jgi:hypothetical protein
MPTHKKDTTNQDTLKQEGALKKDPPFGEIHCSPLLKNMDLRQIQFECGRPNIIM